MREREPRSDDTSPWRRLIRGSAGAAAVEFALVLNLLFLLIMGMLEFGLAFSMRQVIINASREGARYGIAFRVDAQGNRIPPVALTPSITSWVLVPSSGGVGLTSILPGDNNPTVTVSGTGATTGNTGDDLRVTVTCTYNFYVMDKLLPFLGGNIQLAATTVMRVE